MLNPKTNLTLTLTRSLNLTLTLRLTCCRYWVGPLAAAVYLPIVMGEDRSEDPEMDLGQVKTYIQGVFDRRGALLP